MYRLLKDGEIVLPTDEYMYHTLDTERWAPCLKISGGPWRAGNLPVRRKIEDSNDLNTVHGNTKKCLCDVYNVGDTCGDIAVNKDCPFHGKLLNAMNNQCKYKHSCGHEVCSNNSDCADYEI